MKKHLQNAGALPFSSVLGSERTANGIDSCRGIAGTDADLPCSAVGAHIVVNAIFHVATNPLDVLGNGIGV